MKEIDSRQRRIVTVLVVAIALLMLSATMVVANHNFSDVPTGAYYHSAVDWGVDRGLIAGCGSGKFCPNSALTRGQAMVIMKKLGGVVSPSFLTSQGGPAPVDLDGGSPTVCVTSASKRSYEQVAQGYARSTLDRVGGGPNPVAFVGKVAYQNLTTGSGWIIMPPIVSSTSQSNTAGESIHNVHFGTLNLAPNNSYRFGIRLEKRDDLSSGDATAEGQYSCALTVQLFNRPL